jgi:hypothetical protein
VSVCVEIECLTCLKMEKKGITTCCEGHRHEGPLIRPQKTCSYVLADSDHKALIHGAAGSTYLRGRQEIGTKGGVRLWLSTQHQALVGNKVEFSTCKST